MSRTLRTACLICLPLALAACSDPLDLDLRGRLGGGFNTTEAAQKATADRPRPDDRGVISYPSYQVAVARRGDTVAELAARVGLPEDEVARYNGVRAEDALRKGEVVALPRRVAEPSPQTGAATTGPIRPAAEVDVTTLAAGAIDRAAPTPARRGEVVSGEEPVRHKVDRGETAFTIARLYDVSPRALAEWNGLDRDFTVREGQFLLIPVAQPGAGDSGDSDAAAEAAADVPEPGRGSPTPTPPSASRPLPEITPPAAADPLPPEKPDAGADSADADSDSAAADAPVADIGQSSLAPPDAAMVMPVEGRIIREYAKGRNEGIDIAAPAGTPVKAAASGQVAAVSATAEGVKFLLIRHPDNLITVYINVDDLQVNKGDAVSRGQSIGKIRDSDPSFLHFEVRQGTDSTDPMPYLR